MTQDFFRPRIEYSVHTYIHKEVFIYMEVIKIHTTVQSYTVDSCLVLVLEVKYIGSFSRMEMYFI